MFAIAFKWNLNRITSCSRHIKRNYALFAKQGVDQCRLAYVWAPYDCDLDTSLRLDCRFLQRRVGFHGLIKRFINQIHHTIAMGCRDHIRITKSQFVKIGSNRGVFHPFGFIYHQHHGTTRLAQEVRDGFVMRGQSLSSINDEHDDVSFGNRLLGLLGHLMHDAVFGNRLKTTCIDSEKRPLANSPLTIVTVTRQSRQISDQGIT